MFLGGYEIPDTIWKFQSISRISARGICSGRGGACPSLCCGYGAVRNRGTAVRFWAVRRACRPRRKGAGSKPAPSACKKASQSLPPGAANRVKTDFCRGAPQGGLSCSFGAIHLLYLAENTSQTPSVRLARLSAQGVRAGGCKNPVKKPRKGIFDSQGAGSKPAPK